MTSHVRHSERGSVISDLLVLFNECSFISSYDIIYLCCVANIQISRQLQRLLLFIFTYFKSLDPTKQSAESHQANVVFHTHLPTQTRIYGIELNCR